jgi:RHH-type proline utilization regulon transcriptional repressor/proline dehydrogenase/delta 1-pyrroline-5-carboxylate dehydrogenase
MPTSGKNMNREIVDKAISQAETWQSKSEKYKTKQERAFHAQMHKMVENPLNKVFLTELIDKAFRPSSPFKTASLINNTIEQYGIPKIFNSWERFLMQIFFLVGKFFAPLTVTQVVRKIKGKTSSVILHGQERAVENHIVKRAKQNTSINVNLIGELVLSETEAQHKIDAYLRMLKVDSVNYLSIKISNIYSQINSFNFDGTVQVLVNRLTIIFRAAKQYKWTNPEGKQVHKFINLDMEEYRDMELTIMVFKKTLDLQEFSDLKAGIVLQAYLPDSYIWQQDLTNWALERVVNGSAPIKIRIVKGANLDMEQTEASIRNWSQAPYETKVEADANYKRMLIYALKEARVHAVNIGVASHNIFEIAFAYELALEHNLLSFLDFEMLEGMSDGTRAVLLEEGLPILLYTPVASEESFINSIAYFVRRLDENTAPENFLTHSFHLLPNTPNWEMLKGIFLKSVELIPSVGESPNRQQNRSAESDFGEFVKNSTYARSSFVNEPDTDWALPLNRTWAKGIRAKWMFDKDQSLKIPLVINGKEILNAATRDILDVNTRVKIGEYTLANTIDIDNAIETAGHETEWKSLTFKQRHEILSKVAQELRKMRADFIGVAAAEVGKLFTETDVEVSEAIDFAEYYPLSLETFTERNNLQVDPKGVGLIIPPWNFPIAIPAGGILASLAAGNNTIIKPAPQSVYCAYLLCQAFWEAGVPSSALQFLPTNNDPEGTYLISHPKIDFTIFTGSTKTGLFILERQQDSILFAETGGKNATIVTAAADRDLAIKNILQSAFGNSGQKCSATSLVILEEEVFYDDSFKSKLIEGIKSLKTGKSWDFGSKVGPLTNSVGGNLKEAIETQDENWEIKPELNSENDHILSPGLIWGIDTSHYTYSNELFGPIVSVMKASDLKEAIQLVNNTGYGLTTGLESLDEKEIDYWKNNIEAGNLYINRSTTGAVVLRQPFGGIKKSSIGAGIKAGGPNYVQQFANIKETGLPETRSSDHEIVNLTRKFLVEKESILNGLNEAEFSEKLIAAANSYGYEYDHHFSEETDYFQLRGEENIFRYNPVKDVLLVLDKSDSLFDACAVLLSTALFKIDTSIGFQNKDSFNPNVLALIKSFIAVLNTVSKVSTIEIISQELNDTFIAENINNYERLRACSKGNFSKEIKTEANKLGKHIFDSKPKMDGRLELLNYVNEQSISYAYHRYGNLGIRGIKN